MHLSKYMTDKLEPKSEENLYRKQYGNLKECVLAGKTIMTVFKLDGTCFKFQKPDIVEAVYKAGNMEQAGWEKYSAGRVTYLTKHLTMCKNFAMNICVNCDTKYYVKGKPTCSLSQSGTCTPKYDFTKDENVLNCEM